MCEKRLEPNRLPSIPAAKLDCGQVRLALPEDCGELCRLLHLAMRDYTAQLGEGVRLEALEEDEAAVLHAIQTQLIFVLEKNRQLLASLRLGVDDGRYRISRFFVDPGNQGSGLGRALFTYVIDYLKELSADGEIEVELYTALANRRKTAFYERFNFELSDTSFDRGYARGRFVLRLPVNS